MLTPIIRIVFVSPLIQRMPANTITIMATFTTAPVDTPPGCWFLPRIVASHMMMVIFTISGGWIVNPAMLMDLWAPFISAPNRVENTRSPKDSRAIVEANLEKYPKCMFCSQITRARPIPRKMQWRIRGA